MLVFACGLIRFGATPQTKPAPITAKIHAAMANAPVIPPVKIARFVINKQTHPT
jgi:hypothetical protein